jgi:hypothetical protein
MSGVDKQLGADRGQLPCSLLCPRRLPPLVFQHKEDGSDRTIGQGDVGGHLCDSSCIDRRTALPQMESNPMPLNLLLKNLCAASLVAMMCSFHSACGVVYSYNHSEDRLAQPLSSLMTKTDVDRVLGEPGKVVKDNGKLLVLEYRLYSRHHWMKELVACPFTAWLGGCLFYPAIGVGDPNYPKPFYVVFYEEQLCSWGTLDMVSESTTCQAPLTASTNGHRDGP